MDDNPIVPLSNDLELRPARTAPESVGRLLRQHVGRYVNDLVEATEALKRLAAEARDAQDHGAEAALRAKIVDQACKVLALCGGEVQESNEIRSQADVPRWESFPADVRAKLEEAFQYAEHRMGTRW